MKITTKQIRKVMQSHGKDVIYTNKYKNRATEKSRRVKCYGTPGYFDSALVTELSKLVGRENITFTDATHTIFGLASIIVDAELGEA